VVTSLNSASTALRSQALGLGFEPVDRADPPGTFEEPDQRAADRSSNLTLADTNEEAANSQALSTRQSIAVSALSLAQPVAAERAAAPALSRTRNTKPNGGGNPPFF